MKERDIERHPAFGLASVSRVSAGPPGHALFDSELRHHEYVVLRICPAYRERELNRDWIHGESKDYIEIAMSMAQWGAFVSSFNTSGVPCTISYLDGERIESVPYAPRMHKSLDEIDGATDKFAGGIEKATEAVREAFDRKAGRREMADLLRNLELALSNGKSNARYVAESFSEHVEKTVTKAKYDIEAMVQSAQERGVAIGTGDVMLELTPGEEETWPEEATDGTT